MAFAITNQKLDSTGSMWHTSGNWTGSIGDTTTGSIVVGGANVVSVLVGDDSQSTAGASRLPYTVSTDTTTGLSTVSWNYQKAITAGTFSIIYN